MKVYHPNPYLALISIVIFCASSLKVFAFQVQEVNILADDDYPPYSYVVDGKIRGIYIDLVNEAAKELSAYYKVNIIAKPWKRALYDMQKGTAFAILPPYQRIKERPFIWPYSVQILKEEVVAFCNKNVKLIELLNSKTIKDKKTLIIGVNAGYLLLNNILKRAESEKRIIVVENKSTRANIKKLLKRRIDCYLNDKHSTYSELENIKKTMPINFDSIAEALIVMIQTGHIGYSNDPENKFLYKEDFILRMDDALSRLKLSKKYQKIINNYTVTD